MKKITRFLNSNDKYPKTNIGWHYYPQNFGDHDDAEIQHSLDDKLNLDVKHTNELWELDFLKKDEDG